MGRHVCFGILGFLRMLHERFKFTAFDTLLLPEAENDENYGLANILNPDLFALLYTAIYLMCLCDNFGIEITKEHFIPLLKNSSLYIVRYFRQLCARELSKFSVRSFSASSSARVGHATKLKSYFNLLYQSYLSISKPLGYSIRKDVDIGDHSIRNVDDYDQSDMLFYTRSNFARKIASSIAEPSIRSTPSSSYHSTPATNDSHQPNRHSSTASVTILTNADRVACNDSSEEELMFTEPAASTVKRSRTHPDKQQTQPDNGPQSPTKRSAKAAKQRPDLSQDEHLKYLPISTLGPHAGAGNS